MNFFKLLTGDRHEPHSIKGLVRKRACTGLGGFVDLNNDLGVMVDGLPDKKSTIMMPYLYARSIATAGMYMQGAVSKEGFDYVEDLFHKFMIGVGANITKQEQVKFQENSFDRALEVFPAYVNGVTRKSSGLMTLSARAGVSLRDALFYAIDEEQEEFERIVEAVMCASGIIKAEFCAGFFSSGWWDVEDEFEDMPDKLIKYFASVGFSFT